MKGSEGNQYANYLAKVDSGSDERLVTLESSPAGMNIILLALHANATKLDICDLLSSFDVSESFKEFFASDRKVSYNGHSLSNIVVQVTKFIDRIFNGYVITDRTCFWNFFNRLRRLAKNPLY
ncbi:hypothetical protein E2542_SST09008 [Spatholobus suberectus]|nr:hypothetical protein E2542_SST09008 [Spatholobus suberectus]